MASENKHRIELKDLKKDPVFKVDDGYFENLPGRIQQRVTKKQTEPWFVPSWLRLAVVAPVMIVIFAVGYILYQGDSVSTINVEAMLEEVDTNDLIAYLDNSDLTVDELLEIVGPENMEFEDFDSEDFMDFSDQDLSEIDMEELYDEFDL